MTFTACQQKIISLLCEEGACLHNSSILAWSVPPCSITSLHHEVSDLINKGIVTRRWDGFICLTDDGKSYCDPQNQGKPPHQSGEHNEDADDGEPNEGDGKDQKEDEKN